MSDFDSVCPGRGSSTSECYCACHVDPSATCDALFCSPISARASDNVRFRHTNRDPDAGKQATRRGSRSLRKR